MPIMHGCKPQVRTAHLKLVMLSRLTHPIRAGRSPISTALDPLFGAVFKSKTGSKNENFVMDGLHLN